MRPVWVWLGCFLVPDPVRTSGRPSPGIGGGGGGGTPIERPARLAASGSACSKVLAEGAANGLGDADVLFGGA